MSENDEVRLSSISKASSYEEIGEFWDTHSSADYWEQGHDVEVELRIQRRHRVNIEAEVYERIADESRQRGVLPETLINMWLVERLQSSSKKGSVSHKKRGTSQQENFVAAG